MKASVVRAVVLVVLVILAANPASVVGHNSDSGGSCSGDVHIVLYAGASQSGTNDDFCFTTSGTPLYSVGDPNFAVNNAASSGVPADDIGNNANMSNIVTSLSIWNPSLHDMCVYLFTGNNYTGLSQDWYVGPNGHLHVNVDPLINNATKSMQVGVNTLGFPC